MAGIVVVNATAERLEGLTITAGGDGLPELESDVPPIASFTFWSPLATAGHAAPGVTVGLNS